MAQMNTGNYDALAWVQNEVQQSLADALQILTRFIDAPQDVAVIEPCITQLHQVTGIMEMLGLQGALLLSQEMLSSATAIRSGQNANNEQLQDSLLKGLLLLPNYLNQIGPDVRDHPLRLIETINELRLSRNEQMISAESLFKPSLSVPLPNEVIPKPHQSALKSNISADKINHVFQVSLVNWIKTDDDSSLGKLSQLIHYLRLSCSHERNIILWWVAEGVIEALQQGGLAVNTKSKLSLSKLNEPIKLLTKHDEQYLHSLFPTELVQQLLLLVAQATSSGSHVNLLKKVFSLDYFDPQLHQQIYSFTDNALTEARAGILEQIHEAKEQLNQFDNNDETAPSIVEQLATQFASLASALSLISEQTASDLLLKQSDMLSTAHAGNALPDDDQLMSLADDLLRVENQLQHSHTVSVQQPHQDDQLQRTVIDECLNELANIKETLILVENNPSNSGDIISEAAMQLNLVAGSTAMLNLGSTASLLEATAEKMTVCHNNGSGLNDKELGLFAELISAIELYLEGLSQHGQRQTQLLDHAQYQLQNFEKLLSDESGIEHTVSQDNIEVQTPDLPFQEQVPAQTDTSVDRYIQQLKTAAQVKTETSVDHYLQQLETAAQVKTETSVDHYLQQLETAAQVRIESQAESELELADIELTVEHTNASTPQFAMGVDPDIAEVFIEEANEVMEELNTLIPQWKSNQDNNTLATIRRHYHTLKGSGRMAGADVIGELSWSVEESLNRVTDGNIASSPELEQLLTNSHQLIPELLTRFIHGNTSSVATVTELIDLAKQILNPAVEIEVLEPIDTGPVVPELLQAFSDEAMQHLNTFKINLAEATSPFPIDKTLLQASHSLKACANEAQVYAVANVSNTLDNYLQTFYNNDITLNEAQLGKLNESIEGLTLLVDDATASRNNEQHVYDLLSKLNDMRPDLQLSEDQQRIIPESVAPEPVALETVDTATLVPEPINTEPEVPTLLQVFNDEAMQHLNTFKISLAEATSPFPIDKTLLQASHSLKACANEAQVYAVANVSTTLDNYLQTFYNNDITLNEVQLGKLNESIEGLTLLVDDATASRNNEQHVYDLLSKLNDMRPDLQLSEDQQRIIPESAAPEPVALETVDTATLVPEPINTEPEVPTLLQVFNDEAMQHLNTFKISLAEATSPFPIDKTLLQASHSLKACANEAQVYVVANVSTTLDNYLQTFYNNDITLNEAQLGKLNESIEGLTLLVDDATASRNNEQHVYDLLNKLNDMRPDLQLSEDQQGNIPEPAALEPVDDEPDVPDHVDTELLQIFSDEAMQHLNTFKATLAEATWPFRLDKTLLQASHSLKGCANVAQVYAVANVATTLDTNLHNFYNNGITLNETQLGKLNETIEGLTLLVDDAAASRNNEQQVYDLLSKLNDIQPGTQLAGVQQRIDPEILTAFLEETAELFEQYELLRQQLSQLPDDPDYKTALQQTLLKLDENADHAELPLLTELYQSLMQLTAEPDISENALSTLIDMGSVQFTNIIESLVKNQDLPDISDFKGSVSTYFEQVETNISEQANDAIELEADPDSVHSYMPEADEELLEAFTEECAELLESSGLAIKQWQKDPSNNEAAQQIQRDLHTLKGGARLTAITPLADLTHHTESLTLMASDNKCETDAEFFNLLQRCQDRLADMQEQFSRRSDIMLADDLITEIHHFSTQRDPESTAVDITQLIPTVSPPVENETTSSKTKSSSGGEQVRVKADLLDFLTNFAGEVSISRDRVSQQNTAMRQQLTEMESTVERLQEQLRKLEMETEAQILFRYEDQALQGRSEFDPLELDRFSQMQQLSRGLTESVTDLHDITHSIEDLVRESDTILLQQSRLSTDIQQGLMNTRLLPFNGLVPRLERIVRQTNTELDKQSELVVYGADRELDRTILDHIVAPIEHILRNAISHGIESQQERQQSEKNDVAQLTLTITHDGSEILITLSDDGRGIDVEKIRQKALANNLINPDKMPSDEELIQLILHSGFSTADDISQLAGRGVGMDVVNSEIRTLKGRLSIQSVKGQGTSFNIRLPLTLSVMQALLVGCAEEQYAIPLASVHAGERIAIKDIKTLLAQGDEARYEFNGVDYQFMALATLLNQPFNLQDDHAPQLPLLLFNSGEMQVALLVDSINSSREIVLKSVGEQLGHIAAINGATILGDGHVVFVLDIPTLVNTVDETMAADNLLDSALSTLHSIQNRLPLAMVVDDSITMRKASGNLLKRHGFEVITARDGIDAVALLNEQIPDVILLDVEMPRMDGFEFATLVRNDEQFSHLPIIMITSRTGEKHRSRARAIGVDAYLGKPYQEGELVDRLQSILGNKYPNPD